MVKFSLLLSYRGLPKSWEKSSLGSLPAATQMKLEKASKAIKETQKGGIVYVQGDPAIILGSLWEEGSINNFVGLDFPKYFTDVMSKDKNPTGLAPRRYSFIYGVGLESALNKQFSGQLLKQLIQNCKNEEVWCFVCGDTTKAKFNQDYGIDINNSISLPKEVEIKLF